MDYGNNEPFSIENPNQDEGELYGGKLVPGGGTLKVQNSSSLEIPGIDSILIEVYDGTTYSYRIVVHGACPKGKYDNHLEFTDNKGDTYSLRIYDETPSDHTVRYSSSDPTITKVTWDI
jgi:hypothetical protein